MKKRILQVLNTGSYSGAENVVITIIDGFRQYGYGDIDFIYVSLDGSIRETLKEHDIQFAPIKKMSVGEIKRIIKQYKPDIIHAHDFTTSIICAAAAGKIPVISHIHNNSPWIKTYCINSFIYGLSCAKYKKILGVSASIFDEYVFGKYIKSKSQVVGNPIDIEKIRKAAEDAEENQKYDVVFLGRFSPQKKPVSFVEIIKRIKDCGTDVKAVMIGDGELRSEVEKKIHELELENNITLKGFMKNPYGILKNSKALCMPSGWEGFGLAAVEALALGSPVAAAPVGGLPDIVNDSCGRLCRNTDEFAEFLQILLGDDKYLAKMSCGAIKRAAELNNIEKYIKNIVGIYC